MLQWLKKVFKKSQTAKNNVPLGTLYHPDIRRFYPSCPMKYFLVYKKKMDQIKQQLIDIETDSNGKPIYVATMDSIIPFYEWLKEYNGERPQPQEFQSPYQYQLKLYQKILLDHIRKEEKVTQVRFISSSDLEEVKKRKPKQIPKHIWVEIPYGIEKKLFCLRCLKYKSELLFSDLNFCNPYPNITDDKITDFKVIVKYFNSLSIESDSFKCQNPFCNERLHINYILIDLMSNFKRRPFLYFIQSGLELGFFCCDCYNNMNMDYWRLENGF